MEPIFIGLVGDYDHEVIAHRAIPKALGLAALSLGRTVDAVWVGTEDAERDPEGQLGHLDAIWCVPASPYRSMEGALEAIRRAREDVLPFLGTCGGFQHAAIEFARNVCGIHGAEHAESSPDAASLLVTPLECSMVGKTGRILLSEGSLARRAYGPGEVVEEYHCNFGLNPAYRRQLEAGGMRFTGFDPQGDPRVMELPDHPFFVGTLFQPERVALRNVLPPLVRAFLRAVAARKAAFEETPEQIAAEFGEI